MSEEPAPPGDVTQLLRASSDGDAQARERLVETMYGDLRRLAGHLMQAERPGHTLQPTALVNELMVNMLGESTAIAAQNRQHLMLLAAKAMRHLLIDHARGRRAGKRGGGVDPVAIQPEIEGAAVSGEKLLIIHNAITSLETQNTRQAAVAEMRIFGGFSVGEIAETLGVTARTVDRDWMFARAWLQMQLK